jgi:hypothetical protein
MSDPPLGDLQAGTDDCLLRLPSENRFGVVSVKVAPGTEVGEPPLALEVEVRFADGRSRYIPIRSKAWVNGYFEGKGRLDTCRSLLFPPDILAIVEPMVVVEQIAAHSVVRGVMCLLRHEQGCTPVP